MQKNPEAVDQVNEVPRQQRIIKEQVSTGAVTALMANYRDAQQAFMELVDNAVDNGISVENGEVRHLPQEIRIRVTRNELTVFNRGGRGLDFVGLENFFVWGYSNKTLGQIGFYGVGGKSAMGYLGRSMEVVCSPAGSDVEYRVIDDNWESRPEGLWREYEPEERRASTPQGYFRARITNIKREVSASALMARLGNIYRPLLLEGTDGNQTLRIFINGREVPPLPIRYLETDPDLKPQNYGVNTKLGERFLLRVGVLEEGQRVKPGIRCYYRGRLIEDEQFFGHPTPAQMTQASRLIGEAHLDFVPVTPNKGTFIHSSVQWEQVTRQVNAVLRPWMEKLAKLRLEQRSQVENYENDIVRRTKRVLEHVLAMTGLITRRELIGESGGRLPPLQPGIHPSSRREQSTTTRTGRTAPQLGATIAEETIKRWGALDRWEAVSMGMREKRADVIQEMSKLVLKINSDYPLYQAAKKAGDGAFEIYIAETAVMEICKITTEGKTVEEYVNLLNQLLSHYGETLGGRLREKSTTKGRR